MVLKRLTAVILLLLPIAVQAQSVDDAVEQWLIDDGNEEAVAEMADALNQLREEPVNINDTNALADLPLLSPFQRMSLRNYIMLYGQLLSIEELLFVPGFDSATVCFLAPFITVKPYVPTEKWRLSEGHHSLVAGLGGTVEQAAGYGNGRYDGDNMRALLLYNFNYQNKVDVRLVADKDPKEGWGRDNYFGGHVMISNVGRIERLIVGRYNLQFGQGLVLWSGLQPFNLMGVSPVRYGTGVRKASAFYEDNYQQGVAATVNVGRGFHVSGFASHDNGETLLGGHGSLRRGNIIVGATVAYTMFDDSIEVKDYIYNANRFRGRQLLNVGVDAVWQWRMVTLYGELAADDSMHCAMVVGADIAAFDGGRLGVSYRNYGGNYHSLNAQGYGIGHTQGERGLSLDASLRLPLKIQMLTSVDIHSFPSLRYGSYNPSSGDWLRLQLSRRFFRRIEASLRYAYRRKERNVPYATGNAYVGEQTFRNQWEAKVGSTLGRWNLTGRAIISDFKSENDVHQQGWLVAAAARYSYGRWRADASAAWFDVNGYYARIYLTESSMQYSWYIPALNGKGLRFHALVSYKLAERLNLAGRYDITVMPGVDAIGSGDARTEGNHRQMWHLQLRLKF